MVCFPEDWNSKLLRCVDSCLPIHAEPQNTEGSDLKYRVIMSKVKTSFMFQCCPLRSWRQYFGTNKRY